MGEEDKKEELSPEIVPKETKEVKVAQKPKETKPPSR